MEEPFINPYSVIDDFAESQRHSFVSDDLTLVEMCNHYGYFPEWYYKIATNLMVDIFCHKRRFPFFSPYDDDYPHELLHAIIDIFKENGHDSSFLKNLRNQLMPFNGNVDKECIPLIANYDLVERINPDWSDVTVLSVELHNLYHSSCNVGWRVILKTLVHSDADVADPPTYLVEWEFSEGEENGANYSLYGGPSNGALNLEYIDYGDHGMINFFIVGKNPVFSIIHPYTVSISKVEHE